MTLDLEDVYTGPLDWVPAWLAKMDDEESVLHIVPLSSNATDERAVAAIRVRPTTNRPERHVIDAHLVTTSDMVARLADRLGLHPPDTAQAA